MLTVLRRTKREFWLSEFRCATGRGAVKHLLNITEPPLILMPSYVPEGIIGPCKQGPYRDRLDPNKTEVRFYRLNPDLTPDLNSIDGNLKPGVMVIVINYFGYPTGTNELRVMVDDAGGFLFEDCAHTLYDEATKARNADVALWSLNKFMPVTDGAILRSRNKKINVRPVFKPQAVHQDFWRLYHEHLDKTALMVEWDDLSLLAESEAAYEKYYKMVGYDYRPYEQSEESRYIESQFDIEQEKRTRTTNAWRMKMVLPGLRDNDLPQFAFPLMCNDTVHRLAVESRLMGLGILPLRQVDKWDHVPRDGTFTAEMNFMDRHLLLPLGDHMSNEFIGKISGAL